MPERVCLCGGNADGSWRGRLSRRVSASRNPLESEVGQGTGQIRAGHHATPQNGHAPPVLASRALWAARSGERWISREPR